MTSSSPAALVFHPNAKYVYTTYPNSPIIPSIPTLGLLQLEMEQV